MRNTRLAGHELRNEGRIYGGYGIGYINGAGRATCTCGDKSPDLPTSAARKRWHREHKQQVRDTASYHSAGDLDG